MLFAFWQHQIQAVRVWAICSLLSYNIKIPASKRTGILSATNHSNIVLPIPLFHNHLFTCIGLFTVIGLYICRYTMYLICWDDVINYVRYTIGTQMPLLSEAGLWIELAIEINRKEKMRILNVSLGRLNLDFHIELRLWWTHWFDDLLEWVCWVCWSTTNWIKNGSIKKLN